MEEDKKVYGTHTKDASFFSCGCEFRKNIAIPQYCNKHKKEREKLEKDLSNGKG